jgi:hypothetical protein
MEERWRTWCVPYRACIDAVLMLRCRSREEAPSDQHSGFGSSRNDFDV